MKWWGNLLKSTILQSRKIGNLSKTCKFITKIIFIIPVSPSTPVIGGIRRHHEAWKIYMVAQSKGSRNNSIGSRGWIEAVGHLVVIKGWQSLLSYCNLIDCVSCIHTQGTDQRAKPNKKIVEKIEHTERKKITTRLEFTWLQDRWTDAEVSYPKKSCTIVPNLSWNYIV